jgi:hypothetical protein
MSRSLVAAKTRATLQCNRIIEAVFPVDAEP